MYPSLRVVRRSARESPHRRSGTKTPSSAFGWALRAVHHRSPPRCPSHPDSPAGTLFAEAGLGETGVETSPPRPAPWLRNLLIGCFGRPAPRQSRGGTGTRRPVPGQRGAECGVHWLASGGGGGAPHARAPSRAGRPAGIWEPWRAACLWFLVVGEVSF